jgi:hypothetical protein
MRSANDDFGSPFSGGCRMCLNIGDQEFVEKASLEGPPFGELVEFAGNLVEKTTPQCGALSSVAEEIHLLVSGYNVDLEKRAARKERELAQNTGERTGFKAVRRSRRENGVIDGSVG